MPSDGIISGPLLQNGVWILFDWGVVLFTILYFVFSLIVVRQVNLMTETLITQVSGYIRVFAILHALFALGFSNFAYRTESLLITLA